MNLAPTYSETQHSCWVQKRQKTGSRREKTRSSIGKCFWLPQHYTDTTESQAFPLGSLTMLSQSPKSTYNNTTSHGFFLFLGNKGLLEDDGVWTSLEASCFFLLFQFFFQLLERKPVRQLAMTTTSMTQVLVFLTVSSIKTADDFIYNE